jgi:hypothetical protein
MPTSSVDSSPIGGSGKFIRTPCSPSRPASPLSNILERAERLDPATKSNLTKQGVVREVFSNLPWYVPLLRQFKNPIQVRATVSGSSRIRHCFLVSVSSREVSERLPPAAKSCRYDSLESIFTVTSHFRPKIKRATCGWTPHIIFWFGGEKSLTSPATISTPLHRPMDQWLCPMEMANSAHPHPIWTCVPWFSTIWVFSPHLICFAPCHKRSFITYEKPIFTTRVAANLRHWRPHAQRSWSTFGWISIFDMTTWLLPCHVTVKQTEYIFPLPPLLQQISCRLHITKSQLTLSNQPT